MNCWRFWVVIIKIVSNRNIFKEKYAKEKWRSESSKERAAIDAFQKQWKSSVHNKFWIYFFLLNVETFVTITSCYIPWLLCLNASFVLCLTSISKKHNQMSKEDVNRFKNDWMNLAYLLRRLGSLYSIIHLLLFLFLTLIRVNNSFISNIKFWLLNIK